MKSRIFNWGIKLALTLGAFWLVLRGIDYTHLEEILRQQDHAWLLAAGALIALQMALGGLRWHLILGALVDEGQPVLPLKEALRLYYINVFFNNCLPGTVGGDVVRVWMTKSSGVPLPLAINSVIIDRVIALLALGIMVMVTLPVLGSAVGFDGMKMVPLMVLVGIMGIVGVIYAERLLAPIKHLRPVHWFLYFIGCLRLLVKHPAASLLSLIYAMLAHGSFCVSAYVLAHSLGIDLSLWNALTFMPLVILAMTLPISIGGWGVREAGVVGMLGLIGVKQAAALMLSLQLGLICVFVSLPAGLVWLTYRKRKAVA